MSSENTISLVSCNKCFGGKQEIYSHESQELNCKMRFTVYIPPNACKGVKVPAMYWLSGYGYNEESFTIESGFQRYASQENIIVVGPDTSPRDVVIEGEEPDVGAGGSFYLDATVDKFKHNFRMHSYITKELPKIIEQNFPVLKAIQSIAGHSMGGHGALVCALRNPGLYKCVTVFALACNPSKDEFYRNNFTTFLGTDEKVWEEWDSTYLVQKYNGPELHLIVEWGSLDQYLSVIMAQNLIDSCSKANIPIIYKQHEGYDHFYHFVSTFIGEHIRHHSKILYNYIK